MATKDEPFSNGWLDALVKTFVMFIGELEFGDLTYGGNSFAARSIGKLIALAFAFLFAVVVMNLLNAVAIGDIQVLLSALSVSDTNYSSETPPNIFGILQPWCVAPDGQNLLSQEISVQSDQ